MKADTAPGNSSWANVLNSRTSTVFTVQTHCVIPESKIQAAFESWSLELILKWNCGYSMNYNILKKYEFNVFSRQGNSESFVLHFELTAEAHPFLAFWIIFSGYYKNSKAFTIKLKLSVIESYFLCKFTWWKSPISSRQIYSLFVCSAFSLPGPALHVSFLMLKPKHW